MSLTKDDIQSMTRSSYIIQECGETKTTDDLDLTRTTPGNTGLTLEEDDELLIDDIDKQLQHHHHHQQQQQQDPLQDHQRSYQTHYLTNVSLRDSITDLNRLKSDCAKVVITNYTPPRDSVGGGGGGTLRRSPKSVLKKTSIEEPVMSVFHYSPSHSITTTGGCPSATCCGSSIDCPVSTLPGYVTLGRSGSHHHHPLQQQQQQQQPLTNYHPSNQSSQSSQSQQQQQQHQIVYNHRALTPSEILTKGSNLIGRCEEETTA